jgi:two-component system, cell cycle sensor histidine kinase and response regulator CckA
MISKASKGSPEQALVAALPVPALLTTDAWEKGGVTITFANREFCALTGYAAHELEGRHTRLLHGPRTDLNLLRSGRLPGAAPTAGEGEGWLYRKEGSEFYAQWKYQPLSPTGPLIVLYHDHSESWRQREALLQSQKLGTIGLLASGVAHDFNNLLSVINGYCEIMETKVAGVPAAQKDLREIHRAGLKAAAIARQILEFSRRQQDDTAVVNFNTLIREIVEIIRRVCGETIEVELRLASDLGNARINPVHFQQVLLNLCFNARDAMPGGGRLTLRTCNQLTAPGARHGSLAAGSYVAVQVSDNGTGIDPALHQKIFEPFYTTKAHGTGLGLPTAQSIVRQAHGAILVKAAAGGGTTFEVLLPETAEPEELTTLTLGALPASEGTESVLLVERDEGLRKMIAGILAVDGYTVTEVVSPDDPAVRNGTPQLIIADSALVDFLQPQFAANAALRLICTADALPVLAGVADGQVAHLPKPFALSALLTKVRELLDAGNT